MGLRMKSFNILGFHWKIQLLGGGGGSSGMIPKKICRFKGRGGEAGGGEGGGAWQERGWWCF